MSQTTSIPLINQVIKDTLQEFLFKPAYSALHTQIKALVVRNCVICKYSHKSVVYKSLHMNFDEEAPPRPWNRLTPELRPAMDKLLAEMDYLKTQEEPFVMNYITQALNAGQSVSGVMHLLPECLHPAFKKLGSHFSPKDEPTKRLFVVNEKAVAMIKQRLVTNLLM